MKTIQIDNKHYMECDVVMIKTDKAENCLILQPGFGNKLLKYNNTQYFTQEYLDFVNSKSFHLYVISKTALKDEEIPNQVCIFKATSDMSLCLAGKGIGRVKTSGQYYSIVATTAVMLTGESAPKPGDYQYFPQIPFYFIQKYVDRYNKNSVINEVLVKIELPIINENPLLSEFSKVELNNNEISIIVDENKTFTKEQVINLVMSLTSTPSVVSRETATFIVESYRDETKL